MYYNHMTSYNSCSIDVQGDICFVPLYVQQQVWTYGQIRKHITNKVHQSHCEDAYRVKHNAHARTMEYCGRAGAGRSLLAERAAAHEVLVDLLGVGGVAGTGHHLRDG